MPVQTILEGIISGIAVEIAKLVVEEVKKQEEHIKKSEKIENNTKK